MTATPSRTIRLRMRGLYAGAIAITIAACGGAPAKSSSVDVIMPELTLPLVDGGTWSSTSARGAPLVIDVWASWCKPCSKGFPQLNALAANVNVVAITIDEDPAAIRDFIAQHPLRVPIAHDAEQSVTKAPLHIERLPTVLIVDADGRVRHRLEEPNEHDYAGLDELVERDK